MTPQQQADSTKDPKPPTRPELETSTGANKRGMSRFGEKERERAKEANVIFHLTKPVNNWLSLHKTHEKPDTSENTFHFTKKVIT